LPFAGTKREKDISDWFRMGNTREDFIRLFIEFLDTLYSKTMAIFKPCEIDFSNPPVLSGMIVSINSIPTGRMVVPSVSTPYEPHISLAIRLPA
jgi:hypothetical protein